MNVNPQFLPQVIMSLHLQGINLIEKMFQAIVIGSGEISILPDLSVNIFIGSESATLIPVIISNYCILHLP